MPTPINIVLADDHLILSQGCKSLLEMESDFKVVGVAQDGLAAIRMVVDLKPSILILDLAIPKLHGLEVARQVCGRGKATRVIILSAHSEPSMVRQALKHGASGYVLKDSSAEDLVLAVRQVLAGRHFLSASLASLALEAFTHPEPNGKDAYDSLTNQERLVLQMTAEGLTARETAARLFISARTVEVHRKNLLRKLGLASQTELVRFAVRRGIIEP